MIKRVFFSIFSLAVNDILSIKWDQLAVLGLMSISGGFLKSVYDVPYDRDEAAMMLSSLSHRSGLFMPASHVSYDQAKNLLTENTDPLLWALLDQNILRHSAYGFLLLSAMFLTFKFGNSIWNVIDRELVLNGWKKPSAIDEAISKAQNIILEIKKLRAEIQTEYAGKITEQVETLEQNKINVNQFLCPISRAVMVEPVQTADGYYFDYSSIKTWYDRGNRKCLFNHNKPLQDPQTLQINIEMQKNILFTLEQIAKKHGVSSNIYKMKSH